jgi:hypothetical protein
LCPVALSLLERYRLEIDCTAPAARHKVASGSLKLNSIFENG